MEGNWRPTQPYASSMDAASGDWRNHLQPEARQRIVNKIMETLKRHLPISLPEGLNELRRIAIRFEEKIYSAATCQSDYLRKISLKMLSMETKTQQSAPINPAITNAGGVYQNPADPGVLINELVTLSRLYRPNKRQQISTNTSIINCESYSISEDDSATKRVKVSEKVVPEEPSSSRICTGGTEKAKEPTFSCPICMCTMVSPFSTICGHVFCEDCIRAAIKRRKECPTCRAKLTGKNKIHRVFLPTADRGDSELEAALCYDQHRKLMYMRADSLLQFSLDSK